MRGAHFGFRVILTLAIAGIAVIASHAQSGNSLIEAGAPAVVVNGPESIGLSGYPTDIEVMPHGRLLVVSPTEIAIGDGVRWEVMRRDGADKISMSNQVVVDEDGTIYAGVPGGVAKVEFMDRSRWRLVPVQRFKEPGQLGETVVAAPLQLGSHWYWHSQGGDLIRWNPGQKVEVLGSSQTIEFAFNIGDRIFTSGYGNGGLSESRGGKLVHLWESVEDALNITISCTAEYDAGRRIFGLQPGGLVLFDGKNIEPFPTDPLMRAPARISAIVPVGDDHFAVAIDSIGVAFMDRRGRVLQVLDQRSDYRMGRVQKLLYRPEGVLWVLLNDGLARVDFPSRLSQFESRVSTGLNFANPTRFNGKLWLHADGRVLEGDYDEMGRLTSFHDRTPPGLYAFTFSVQGGRLFAGNEDGLFSRVGEKWIQVVVGPANPRVEVPPTSDGTFTYVARNECGRLRPREDGGFEAERHTLATLGEVYSVTPESPTVHWLEMGGGAIARLDWSQPRPQLSKFSRSDGLPEGWVQCFVFDGKVQFLSGGVIFRFDYATQRFVEDEEFKRKHPWIVGARGRPARDSLGRIWYSARGQTNVIDPSRPEMKNSAEDIPPGIEPHFFRMEEGGVVWLHQRRRLLRFDPSVKLPNPPPVRAMITQVEFSGSGKTVYGPVTSLPPIKADDNSFTVRFMAPANPFNSPTTFEFRLDELEDRWVSVGVTGTASFNEMKEGRYTLRVHPVVGGEALPETVLTFSVLPPWYRHPIAYGVYFCLGVGALILAAFVSTYLQRREKERLERLVAERTSAVEDANRQLARQVAETVEKASELRSSEERYRTLYENNPAMYFTVDAAGRVLSVNQYGADQLDYTVEELVGQDMQVMYVEEDRPVVAQHASECFTQPGKLLSWTLRKRRKDGRVLPVKELARAVRQNDGTPVLFLVCEDVSAQLKLEAQLRQAQKMEAVGQLAGGVAHDFNNLLTVIQGQAEWSENHATSPEERVESIKEIRRAAEQAGKLTRQLLVFSRHQAVRSEKADLNEIVLKVVKLIQRVIGEDIRVEHLFAAAQAPVKVDGGMIEQVLINMALNARDAMPKGGRILIEVSPVEVGPERAVGHEGCKPGPYQCISVTDTGSGMSEAVKARLFEPFFTTKAPGQGTGLGLATSATIVSQHQGWIELSSQVGVGTTFRIFLPEQREGTRPPQVQAQPTPPLNGQETILLVEDEPAVRTVTRRMLEKHGYKVIEAENADDAMEKWTAHGHEIELLLTDLVMPGTMNGRQLAEHLKRLKPSLHIRLMSGHDPEVLARKGGNAGNLQPHLLKPFTRDSLLAVIRH